MSRLYFSGLTDNLKNPITARAHKFINMDVHFDDKNRERKINIHCTAETKGDVNTRCGIYDANNHIVGSLDIKNDGTIDLQNL